MGTFILILIVIVGALLGLVILVQNPKGGGLATGFSGAHQIGGVQRTAHFLEKATWYLAISLMVLCVISSYYYSSGGSSGSGMGDTGSGAVGTEQTEGEAAPEGAPGESATDPNAQPTQPTEGNPGQTVPVNPTP